MKKILFALLGVFICSVLTAQTIASSPFEAEAYVIVSSSPGETFEAQGSTGGKLSVGEFKSDGVMCPVVRFLYRNKNLGWETASFKFKANYDGEATLSVSGIHKYKNGKRLRLAVCYDDIKINGKLVPNGDFEDGFNKWRLSKTFPTFIEQETASDGKTNKYLRAWSATYASHVFNVKKGQTYEISFKTKPVGLFDIKSGNVQLDISKYANLKLDDFSMWKCNYNLGGLDKKRTVFGDVKFNLIDPDKNGGKGGILFASKNKQDGLKKIKIDKFVTGNYLYLLHTSFYSSSGDTDIMKITLTSLGGEKKTYIMQRRKDTWFFTDPRVYLRNVRPVYHVIPEKKLGGVFLSRFELPAERAIKSIEIESMLSDAFVLLGATIYDERVPMVETKPFNPDEWVKADIPDDIYVKKGSALDHSHFFDNKPTGAYGRVIISDRGTLAFEKTPEKDARFKGFSNYCLSYFAKLPPEQRVAEIRRYAESFKVTGYNFARISFEILREHMPAEEREILYDTADRLIYELKKNGVYLHLTLVWYRMGLEGYHFYIRDDVKLRAVFGDENVRNHWKANAEYTLNHMNPYTGLRWKDDPVFVCAEYYNELAICFSRMDESTKFDPNDKILPETKELVMSKWHKWLQKRYKGDINALNKAWEEGFMGKNPGYKTFEEVPCIVRGNGDWTRCCWDHLADFVDFAEKVVEGTGYKGLKVQNNLGPMVYGNAVRSRTTDYVIGNTYYSHPSSFNMSDALCPQGDAIKGLAGYWRGITSMKLNDRPFFVTEYNHCYWNKSRYQFPAMFAPYSAFQNFSGLTIHSDAIPHTRKWSGRVGAFAVFPSPVAQVAELFSSAMFIRGDVEPARHRVDIKVSDNFLTNNNRSVYAFSSVQTQCMLLTGFGTSYEGRVPDAVKKVKVKPADMVMTPVGSSEIVAEAWFHGVKEDGKVTEDFVEKMVEQMRTKGILSPDNKTDVKKGIFQSDTNQITMDTKKITLKVVTPRSEIIAMNKPEETRLGALKVISGNVPSTVGVCSLDGKKISDSSRLMFVFVTREGNTDMKLSEDDVASTFWGRPPVVMLKGSIEAEIRLDPNSKYEVYPVALNGERREKIPFEFKDGVMRLKIDNYKLKHGATPMFEIVKL